MAEYWSWWQGGLALAALIILFRVLLHRPLGVSGSWTIIAASRQELRQNQQANAFVDDAQAMNTALMAATLAQFGSDALNKQMTENDPSQASSVSIKNTSSSVGQHATFLISIFIGSMMSAIYTGTLSWDLELSEMLTSLSHGLMQSWMYLLLGGVMVGFGTQMAAGCTSGHGLSGCAQMSGASFLASLVFFSSAIATAVFFSLAI